jgi:hypothetical protein
MADGPLTGIRVLEFASIGPGPFVGMMLSDMGPDVLLARNPRIVCADGKWISVGALEPKFYAQWPPSPIVRDTRQALKNWGVSEETLGELLGASAGERR